MERISKLPDGEAEEPSVAGMGVPNKRDNPAIVCQKVCIRSIGECSGVFSAIGNIFSYCDHITSLTFRCPEGECTVYRESTVFDDKR